MQSWRELCHARTEAGDHLILRQRGEDYEIRCNGWELMSTRAHHSEEALARLACERLGVTAPQVLIGGLGMGYTLRAVLDVLPAPARVTVAELLPEVIAWNRGPLAHLAQHPLDDARVTIAARDVATLLHAATFDAIVLDMDNGPDAVMFGTNRGLYSRDGLALIAAALRPNGILAVWSASRSPRFEQHLAAHGLPWHSVELSARGLPGDPQHAVYLIRNTTA
jgi:spermidine synthase